MAQCKISLFYFYVLFTKLSTSNGDRLDENSAYLECVKSGGTVVSHVFCLPSQYRKDVIPPYKEGPLPVYFKLPISEISEIDDHKSIITIRLSYKLMWPESRMVVNVSAPWATKDGEINISPDNIELFWKPDIIIHDLVSFKKPEIMNQVGALEIFRSRMVYYKVRSDITVVCKAMEFGQFPLDKHKCYLKLTSFGYNVGEMILDGRFDYEKENQRTLPFNVEINRLPEHKTIFKGSSSNYSVYGFEISLSRSLGPFILSVYLPSAMFVMMSWVSFFVPPDIVPARIVLLVTLCLVLINMFNSTTTRIPVSNAVTAMEVWLLACMLLVFLSLVEYAIILRKIVIHTRHIDREKRRSQNGHRPISNMEQPSLAYLLQKEEDGEVETQVAEFITKDYSKTRLKRRKKSWSKQASELRLHQFKINLDRGATYVFPALFFAFNIIYWAVYLVLMPSLTAKNDDKN